MTRLSSCSTKILYDTEFEAELAVARHNTPMRYYKCGRHYHLSHVDKTKSIGYGKAWKYARCGDCKLIMKHKSIATHYCKSLGRIHG